MEYTVGLNISRQLEVKWNGSAENLKRATFARYGSRSIKYKNYLYMPKMPINHTVCMKRRIEKAWQDAIGDKVSASRSILSVINGMKLKNGLYTAKDVLLPIMEAFGLNAADIEPIGYYQTGSKDRRKLIFLFGFNPEDWEHYLKHVVSRGESIIYGRNGDALL